MKGTMKGSKGLLIFDLIVVVGILIMAGIAAMIGDIVLTDFDNSMVQLNQPGYNSSYVQDARQAVIMTNEGSVFIFIGLIAAAIIASYALRQHPIYAIFTILLMFVAAFIVAGMSNFYQDFANDPRVIVAAQDFPALSAMMNNIAAIIFMAGVIIVVAMFAHGRNEGGGQL